MSAQATNGLLVVTYTHTHTHAHTHTHTHTHAHARPRTRTRTRTHVHEHAHARARTSMSVHTRTTHTHARTHAHTHHTAHKARSHATHQHYTTPQSVYVVITLVLYSIPRYIFQVNTEFTARLLVVADQFTVHVHDTVSGFE